MSDKATLVAAVRTRAGKGSARAARREGLVPGVIYGDGKEPVSLTVTEKDLMIALHKGGFFSTLFDVDVDGNKESCLPRDVQFHPVNDRPLHVDFLRVSKNAKIAVAVPVHFANEEACPGLKQGGVLNVVRHEVELNVSASDIPSELVIDLTKFEIGDSIHISEVDLPGGATPVIDDRDFTIATIAAPTVAPADDETEAAGEAEEGGEEATEEGGED